MSNSTVATNIQQSSSQLNATNSNLDSYGKLRGWLIKKITTSPEIPCPWYIAITKIVARTLLVLAAFALTIPTLGLSLYCLYDLLREEARISIISQRGTDLEFEKKSTPSKTDSSDCFSIQQVPEEANIRKHRASQPCISQNNSLNLAQENAGLEQNAQRIQDTGRGKIHFEFPDSFDGSVEALSRYFAGRLPPANYYCETYSTCRSRSDSSTANSLTKYATRVKNTNNLPVCYIAIITTGCPSSELSVIRDTAMKQFKYPGIAIKIVSGFLNNKTAKFGEIGKDDIENFRKAIIKLSNQ